MRRRPTLFRLCTHLIPGVVDCLALVARLFPLEVVDRILVGKLAAEALDELGVGAASGTVAAVAGTKKRVGCFYLLFGGHLLFDDLYCFNRSNNSL